MTDESTVPVPVEAMIQLGQAKRPDELQELAELGVMKWELQQDAAGIDWWRRAAIFMHAGDCTDNAPPHSAFAAVGPLTDGYVEIPLGSGNRFAADGMFSQHPDFLGAGAVAMKLGIDLSRDVPLVIEKYAPLGTLYHCGHIAFVNRRGMKIESVFHVDLGSVRPIFEDLQKRKTRFVPCCYSSAISGGHCHNFDCTFYASRADRGAALANLQDELTSTVMSIAQSPGEARDMLARAIDADREQMYKLTGFSGWLPDESERKRIEGMPLETFPNARLFRPCYHCDARTEVNGDVPLCARCRAEED